MEHERRSAVLELFRAGHTVSTIVRLLKYPKSTVYRIIKDFSENGKTQRAEYQPRSYKIRTPRFVAGLKRSVDANPKTPISILAKQRQVSTYTISKALNDDLGYTSRCRPVKHLLTAKQKSLRVERGQKILSSLKSTSGYLQFFSDEKIFNVDQVHNRRNDRWISAEASDVPPVMTSKNPAAIMVLAVISTDGDVMPPYFFKNGEKVTKEVYMEVKKTVVTLWMDLVAKDRSYTFQQDGAPAHTAKIVVEWSKDHVPHFWTPDFWPPNGPDLNPCDFYLWGRIEKKACATPHKNIASLKRSVTREMARLEAAEVARACKSFRGRVEAVVQANGGHSE